MALMTATCRRLGLLSLRAITTNSSFATKSAEGASTCKIAIPKKNTIYNIFYVEHFQSFKEKDPSMKSSEVTVAVAQEWRALSAEEKAKYAKQHAMKMVAYNKNMADLQEKAKHDPAFKKALEEFELRKKSASIKVKIKKCVRKLTNAGLLTRSKGKRIGGTVIPLMKLKKSHPYKLFLADFFPKAIPAESQTSQKSDQSVAKKTLLSQNFSQASKEAHKQWESLDESTHKEYEVKAKAYNDKLDALKQENKELLDKYKDLLKELKKIEAILSEAEKNP